MEYLMSKVKEVVQVPVKEILSSAHQPRTIFEYDELIGLSKSIFENGIIQPILLKKEGEKNIIIAGERRLKASIIAGLNTIPAIYLESTEEQSALFSLLENVQRRNLNCFDEAGAMEIMIGKYGYTQDQLSKKLGKSQGSIANKLRLLKLSTEIQQFVKQHQLTERHARAVLKLEKEEEKKQVLKQVVEKNLNVQQTEKLVEEVLLNKETKHKRTMVIKDLRIFINTINKAIDVMKTAGIHANVKKQESEEFIEYTIKIPVQQAKKNQVA